MALQIKISVHNNNIPPTPAPVQMYQHKDDTEISDSSWGGGIRPCASCPAVWVLLDDPHVIINRQWQYYMIAINYNMTLENVFLLLDDHLAFANNTGFRNLDNPGKKDYFFNRTEYSEFPSLDKVRTCSLNVMTGREVGPYLHVTTFDSRQPPPLKPGKTYPNSVQDINPEDYLYLPQFNREMFVVATIVNRKGEVVQFPRGALYPWTNDNTPYSFIPLISNHDPKYGTVMYPLSRLKKIPLGSPVPRPYRNEQ